MGGGCGNGSVGKAQCNLSSDPLHTQLGGAEGERTA